MNMNDTNNTVLSDFSPGHVRVMSDEEADIDTVAHTGESLPNAIIIGTPFENSWTKSVLSNAELGLAIVENPNGLAALKLGTCVFQGRNNDYHLQGRNLQSAA